MAQPTKAVFTAADGAFMRGALNLARRGLGRTAPNPTVGCILVQPDLGNRVVGRGWTQPGGRPHAETVAIEDAGGDARGAHAYVTLEPCSHHGKTAPCTDALIAAGVVAVTCAVADPDPRVDGSGISKLQAAGITVRSGLLADQARALNAGFFSVLSRGRPWLTMKTATTLDGAIAARTGASKWITGAKARARGHLLRAQNDAILTGIGTVQADDPALTCRLPGLEDRSPTRIVVDPRLETPTDAHLFKTLAVAPLWLICATNADPARRDAATAAGAEVISLPTVAGGRLDPAAILTALAGRGLTRVLLEAGSALSASFLAADMVDELVWFRAPMVMGGDGMPAVAPMAVNDPGTAAKFRPIETLSLDGDAFERYLRITTDEE